MLAGRLRQVACFAAICLIPFFDIGAAERVALVIGNGEYGENSRLDNPGNDADLIAAKLADLGFLVIKKKDLDPDSMEDALFEFQAELDEGGLALFFYAGHGLQVQGENYLLPVGRAFRGASEVKHRALPAQMVLDVMDEADVALKILILDCCRDNPFARTWRSKAGLGLSTMTPPNGSIIAFATAPGETAADGEGENSPYTTELAYALSQRPEEGLELKEVFFIAGPRVKKRTGQIPWVNMESSLGNYFLTAKGEAVDKGKVMEAGGLGDERFAALQEQNESLKQDLEDLKKAIAELPRTIPAEKESVDMEAAGQAGGELAAAEEENRRLKEEMDQLKGLMLAMAKQANSTPSPGSTMNSAGSGRSSQAVHGTPRAIGESVDESLRAFLLAHMETSAGNDAARWAGMFSSNPEYCYAKGRTNRTALRIDRQKLIDRYPRRHYSIREGAKYTELEGGRKATISFTYDYQYFGSRSTAGSCREILTVEWFDDRWLITEFDEIVHNN